MTNSEAKAALLEERPVIYTGITYQKITALIYRKAGQGKNIQVSAELLDRNGHAVVIASVEKIERGTDRAEPWHDHPRSGTSPAESRPAD